MIGEEQQTVVAVAAVVVELETVAVVLVGTEGRQCFYSLQSGVLSVVVEIVSVAVVESVVAVVESVATVVVSVVDVVVESPVVVVETPVVVVVVEQHWQWQDQMEHSADHQLPLEYDHPLVFGTRPCQRCT